MSNRCTICTHDSREEIDRALLAGVPYRTLAARYALSPSSLCRHTRHLARYLEAMQHHEDRTFQRAILDKLDLLETRLDRMFHKATETHSLRIALDCVREYLRVIALQEKFRVRLPD